MTKDRDHMDEDTAQAGEYVLRLLSPMEHAAFEARLLGEPDLRRLVAEWEEHLVSFTDPIPHVLPRADLKARIQAQLFARDETPQPGLVASLMAWMSPGFGLVLGGLAALAILAGIMLSLDRPDTPVGPLHVAEITAEDESLKVIAVVGLDAAQIDLNRVDGQAQPGRALELWLIAGDAAPVSLGVLPDATQAQITVAEAHRPLLAGATLAISDEPLGGSPTGSPTGAVLAVGAVSTL